MSSGRRAAQVTVVNAVHSLHPRVPLGPLYLCSTLEASGYRVEFRDYQLCQDGVGIADEFASWLAGSAPILAISTLSSSLPLVLASLARRRLRGSVETVILGGPGVGSIGARILERFPCVDVVASGEGEMTLLELVSCLLNGRTLEDVKGIAYRAGGEIRENPSRERIAALDPMPFPAYHHVTLGDYTSRTAPDQIPLAIVSARGCPYSCSFCDIPGMWNQGIRFRSIANVVDELDFLRRNQDISRFHVADDTFVLSRGRVFEFCEALEDHGLVMPWSCYGRVDRVDREILRRLTAAGCETIFYGVESGSDNILRRIRKGFTVSDAMDVVAMSTEHMKTHVSFIWGFPFETLDDLYDTIIALLAMQGRGAKPHLNFLAPLPSAELHRSYGDRETRLLASDIGWNWAMMENYTYGSELRDLICAHPDIFAPFYCFESPNFAEKVRLLESWGLGLGRPGGEKGRVKPTVDGAAFTPADGRPLPGISKDILLRTVGGKDFIFDIDECLLFEPSPMYADIFRACRDRADSGSLVDRLAKGSEQPHLQVSTFVGNVLSKFAQRGFLIGD